MLKLWWITVCLSAACLCVNSFSSEKNCLPQGKTYISKRFSSENELTFKIEVSKRKTHQLVSHILRILLIEAIGYEKVEFVDSDPYSDYITGMATHSLQNITNCVNPKSCEKIGANGPRVMINLEAWLAPGFNLEKWISTGELEDGGSLGPVGTSGWFVAEKAVRDMWQQHRIALDHWRAFTEKSVVSRFDLTDFIKVNNLTFYNYNGQQKAYCGFKECDEYGMYRPNQCMNTSCATLLVDYAESTFAMLKKKIDDLGLLVTVAWIGENMASIVHERTAFNQHTLFFHKKPSILAVQFNYAHVTFPYCNDNTGFICEYQVYQLHKLVWSKIKTRAPQAFHLIRSMAFTQEAYWNLLDKYTRKVLRGFTDREVACIWVKENRFLWNSWIKQDN